MGSEAEAPAEQWGAARSGVGPAWPVASAFQAEKPQAEREEEAGRSQRAAVNHRGHEVTRLPGGSQSVGQRGAEGAESGQFWEPARQEGSRSRPG